MDHLERPKACVPFDPRIPFLASGLNHYDGLGFETFPERRGYVLDENKLLRLSQVKQNPDTDHAAFIQGWLYFGLLQEVFDKQNTGLYQSRDFIISEQQVESNDNGPCCSTSARGGLGCASLATVNDR